MTDHPPDPAQVALPLNGEAPSKRWLSILPAWQRDAMSSALLTAVTLTVVAVSGFVLDWVLARVLTPWALWTIRGVLWVSFIIPMTLAILLDTVRFVVRRVRDLRADWREL